VPSAAAVSPLPRELTTPPVMKMYFICFNSSESVISEPVISADASPLIH
jgi:hypothetical protein